MGLLLWKKAGVSPRRELGASSVPRASLEVLVRIIVAPGMFLWLTFGMTLKLTPKQREAIRQQPGRPIEIEDVEMQRRYILMTQEQYEVLTHSEKSHGG